VFLFLIVVGMLFLVLHLMGYALIAIICRILAMIIAYYIEIGDSFFNKSLSLGLSKLASFLRVHRYGYRLYRSSKKGLFGPTVSENEAFLTIRTNLCRSGDDIMKPLTFCFALLCVVIFSSYQAMAINEGESIIPQAPRQEPDRAAKQQAKRALVWCTNNITKIRNYQVSKSQLKSYKEKYFQKRDALDQVENIMGYKPVDNERPGTDDPASEKFFADKTYGEMIRFCDEAMMDAYNEMFDEPAPTTIAEEWIADMPNQERKAEMQNDQEIGQKLGFAGVTYEIALSLRKLQDGEISVDTLKTFLIKPGRFDHGWRLANQDDGVNFYELWSGETVLLIAVKNPDNQQLVMNSALPTDDYFKVEGLVEVLVVYADGVAFPQNLLLMEHIKP
jgi:hypothetical protein